MALTKITTSVIAANTLSTANIADNSIDATKIASNSILTRHIDDDQVTGDQLADTISIVTDLNVGNDLAVTGNTTITGNLTVNGSTVTNSSTNTTIEDALIELGTGTSGSPSTDAGIVIERGSSDNVFIGWDESADKVTVGTGSFTGASSGNLTITPAAFVSGALTASGIAYPTSDGSSGQVIQTDGSGNLSFGNKQSSTQVDTYATSGDGSTTAFDTGTNPLDEKNTWVFIDGVYQQKSTYSYSGSTITFGTAPDNGAAIDVITGTTDSLASSDTVLGVYEATTTATATYSTGLSASNENNTWVFVGGVLQPKDSYTFSSGTLTFDAATPAGEKLSVTATRALTAGSVVTASMGANAVTSAKIASNSILSRHIANNSIVGADISATTGITAATFTGALTGNVTGNVTGNITGNVLTAAQTNITSVGTLSALTVSGDLTVDTSTLKVDSTNNRVGIGNASPSYQLDVTGNPTGSIAYISQTGTGGGNHGLEVRCASSTAWALQVRDSSETKLGVTGDVVYVSDKLHIGTYTNGTHDLEIHNDAPVINLRDTNGSGTAATGYIEWEDSGGTNLAYIGLGSGSSSTLHITNYIDEANIEFLTNSETQFAITNKDNADSEDCAVFQGTDTGGSTLIDVIRMTKMGYGASYQCTQFGVSGGGRNISLMYDPSTNTSGAFGGNGELIVGNEFKMLGANAANNGFVGMLRVDSSNKLRIGGNYTVGGYMVLDTSGQLTVGSTADPGTFYNGAGSDTGFGGNPSGWFMACRGGTNTPMYISHSSTGSGEFIRFSQSTTGRGYIHWNGSSLQLTSTSDYRVKENIVPITNATTRINALNPVAFDMIESGDSAEGFLAHELQEHVPHAVTGTKDEVYTAEDLQEEDSADLVGTPKYQTVSYASLTPLLVKALQEANTEIQALKARVETLENN